MTHIPQSWHVLADLLNPDGRASDPLADGRHIDWYEIYALAASHLVAPALYAELAKSDRLRNAPIEVQDALGELHRLNEKRNERLQSLLRETVGILNSHGIEPLIMKGAIALLPDQSPAFPTRMMTDLDIALHNAEPERAEKALLAAGYWRAEGYGPEEYADCHHLAPLFDPSGEGYVEIHTKILCDKVPVEALSLVDVCAAASPVEWDGLRLWVPSIEHRLLHNALGHQVQDRLRSCTIRRVGEFVQLSASPAAALIDWHEEVARLDAFGMGDPLRAQFLLGSELFAQPIPAGVHVDDAVRRAEKMKWFWFHHPRSRRLLTFSKRLRRLPSKLVTPSWYPWKYHQLRRAWAQRESDRRR